MTLQQRTRNFLNELELPVTRFCRKVELSRTPLMNWLNGDAQLSQSSIERIDAFLTRYGF